MNSHANNKDNPHSVTKSQVGLGNVDNVKQYSSSNPNFDTATPKMDGTAAVGTATTYSRSDHVHPTDTSRASTEQVDNKVDKLPASLRSQAYVRSANGEDSGLGYTYTDEGGTLAVRNASGQLQVSDPSQDKDATNKSYADALNARYVSTSILGG